MKDDKDFKVRTISDYEDDVKKDYVPEGFEDVESFLKDMREDYQTCQNSDEANRREAVSDKKFAVGEQWDPAVLSIRKDLPCLVINSIPQFTAQLVGDWRQSRNAIKVLPNENGDVAVASLRADLIRSIEYKSRADRVYDSAFESQVICGDGAFRIAVEYARDDVFDQDIFVRPVDDALSVTWDNLSIDPTGRDARKCWVEDKIPRKEHKDKWPDADPSTLGSSTQKTMMTSGWYDDQTVRVVEYWRMIERKRLLGLFEDGSTHVLEGDTLDDLIEKHGNPVKTRTAPCLYAQMHLVTGWKILAGPYEYKLNRLPIIRMMGRVVNIEGERIRYGLVRFMKDSVRLRNFWRSVAAEQLGYAPKAQWIAPESAVAGRESAFRKAHLSRDPLLVYNDDATSPPERIDPPAMQTALLQEAQINTQDMKDVTGIHDASLGIKSNETSGRAIMARQKEGDVASITFYDNGNAALLEAGDVINQLIPQIYDGTRIVRLVGEDEAIKLQKINDPSDPESPNLSVGNYDVLLSTGASYTTRRAEAADAMMQAVQVYPEIMQLAGDLVIKAQDWPGAEELSARIKKTIPSQLLSPEEMKQIEAEGGQAGIDPQQAAMAQEQMQEMQQQLQQLSQENHDLKQKHDIDLEKLEIERYNAETQRIRALSDNMVDDTQLEQNAIAEILQHSREEAAREQEMEKHEKEMQASATATAAPTEQG